MSVPVLSEQIILTEPSVSTAGNFLITAFFLDMLVTPMERTTATMAASPSGIAATASETDKINISAKLRPCNSAIANITTHIPMANVPSVLPNLSNLISKGVFSFLSELMRLAILPT